MNISKETFGGEINPAGFIYLSGFKFRKIKINLELKSCLHYSVINAVPHIGKFINKNELYIKGSQRSVKYIYKNINMNSSCVSSVMTIKIVSKFDKNKWGANSIFKTINDRVYICTCKVTNVNKKYTISHAFLYDSYLNRLRKIMWCPYWKH